MDIIESFVIRTKYLTKFKFVLVPRNDLNVENYLHLALQTFSIEPDETICARLSDNLHTAITKNNFEEVVKTYWRSACFYIQLQYEKADKEGPRIVTAPVRNINMIMSMLFEL